MFYRKNVGPTERALRFIAGVSMVIGALALLGTTPLGLLVAGTGVVSVATGLVGFCPACAMVGRRPVAGPHG